jgi:hypothetical protein
MKVRLAVLIDFGTGHLLGSAPVTAPGTLLGTAEYLPPWYVKEILATATGKRAPRQYKAEPVDDVYQLGVLLYAVLTGSLPMRTPSTQPWQLLEEIRDIPPAHPRELNPTAPAALSALAMRCLEKRSSKLPPDAAALRREWLAALNEDGEALQLKAPEFRASRETTLAETTIKARPVAPITGDGEEAPEVPPPPSSGELVMPELKQQLVRTVRGSHWAVLAAFAALVLMIVQMEFRSRRDEERSERREARQEKATEALVNVAQALSAAMTRASQPYVGSVPESADVFPPSVFGGMKMPDKPRPEWLRPEKDGVCRHPKTREMLRPFVVIRRTCWKVEGVKLPGEPSCPSTMYDPPSEIVKDPKETFLHEACFTPYVLEAANSLHPRR